MIIRALQPGEEDLFLDLPDPGLVGVAAFGRDFREFVANGQYRPQWTWVALRDGRAVARAAWWGGPEDTEPATLDWFDFIDADAAETLLRQAPLHAEYCLLLPPGWRDRPEVRQEAGKRIEVARRTGMRPLVERLHYVWAPEHPVPERTNRLEYRAEPDDDVIFEVLERVHSDTLDAHARAEGGAKAAAQSEMDFLHWMPSPREWWRLAYTPGGDLVGITVPGRNYSAPVIAIIGVVPEQRGHGYGYDLLVESTRFLIDEGATKIIADTDLTNTPMVRAFARAGYPIDQERVFLS